MSTFGTAMRGELGSTLDRPDKRVFTIFCHGTGGHRDGKCEELITEFGGAYWSPEASKDRAIAMKPDGFGKIMNRGTMVSAFISEFYRDHYQRDFLILDGVGTCDMATSTPGKEVGLAGTPNPMPGDFFPLDLQKPLKTPNGSLPGDLGKLVSSLGAGLPGKHRGDIDGDGWNDNIAHALYVLKLLRAEDVDNPTRDKKVFPKVINTIGWSRGGVTTIKLAYWIHKYFVAGEPFKVAKGYQNADQTTMHTYLSAIEDKYKVPEGEIEVNIFAIDPVPGRAGKNGEWGHAKRSKEHFPTVAGDQDYRSLPPIVNNCIITLAADERREGFFPLDAENQADGTPHLSYDRTNSNVVWLPYPGIHRTQLRLTARDPGADVDRNMRLPNESVPDAVARIKAELTALPKLVWDLAWKFLNFHGTEFQRDLTGLWGGPLTGAQICDLFDEVGHKRALYHTGRNRGLKQRGQGGLKYRGFTGYPRNDRPIAFDALFSEKLGDYVCGRPTQFINEHHRSILQLIRPDDYTRRQTSTTHKPFYPPWRPGEGVWTTNPLFVPPVATENPAFIENPLYEPPPAPGNPALTEATPEPLGADYVPLVNDDDPLPENEDTPDPPDSGFPRQASKTVSEAIFTGRIEKMQRSKRFDVLYRPLSRDPARKADDALFIEVLAQLPEPVVTDRN